MRNNNKRSNNITLTQVRHSIPFIQYHQSNYLPVSIHKYIVQQYRIQKITAEARDTFTHTSVCAYVSTPHSQVATSLCHGSLSLHPLRWRWSPADAVCVCVLNCRAFPSWLPTYLTDWMPCGGVVHTPGDVVCVVKTPPDARHWPPRLPCYDIL